MLAFLALLAILIGILAIPVAVAFRVSGLPFKEDVRLVWAFGLVNVRLRESQDLDLEDLDDERGPTDEDAASGGANPLAALKIREFRQRMLRFLRDLWQAVHKDDIRLHARLGLGDPADTGQLWALLGPLSGVLRSVEEAVIDVEPDFGEARFEFDGSGRVTIVPLRIIGIVLALAASPVFWRGVMAMRA